MNWPQRLILMIGGAQLVYIGQSIYARAYGLAAINAAIAAMCLIASKPKKGRSE